MKVKVVGLVTVPVLSLKVGEIALVKFMEAMHIGKTMPPDADGKVRDPATVAKVTNLNTGEIADFIVNKVVQGSLTDTYPDDTYVGRCFQIEKLERKAGKDYNGFKIAEVSVTVDDDDFTEIENVAKPKTKGK